ncbi:MAG TPA: tetratricopeptide repeat protein [Candidatus Polarisedimenticolia bacterium]|nr:tetratricopeptide repeat protein [Candidatus Polarisedimenticolia bacterium]
MTPTVSGSGSATTHRPGVALLIVILTVFAMTTVLVRSGAAAGSPQAPAAERRDAAYQQALGLYRQGRFREALEVIGRAVTDGGWSPALYALAGWSHLREGDLKGAESAFGAALVLEQGALEPQVGLGYVHLRQGAARQAAEEFQMVLRREPRNLDALKGLGLALRNQERFAEAAEKFRTVLRIAPSDAEASSYLDQTLAASGEVKESRPRRPVDPEAPIRVIARAGDARLEIAENGSFRPLFVEGVNLGVALPGRFPAEFPTDEATYAGWLDALSDLGANSVRLYTLLPPAFYTALQKHNLKGGPGRLWLVQGVWTELPDDHDYEARSFLGGFEEEIKRVVDAVHGNLDLPARPGHASGSYRADVSSSLLAFLLGREWEPYSVKTYDELRPEASSEKYRGAYFTTEGEAKATPFEGWLARVLDFTVGYETWRYRQQHPVSFVSWPTLDPLTHPTESTVAEERALLAQRGEAEAGARILEYDNDGVSVDALHIHATGEALAGLYATYHAYPYYPDFMNFDPGYNRARDARGPSNYIGYLRDLKAHHGRQPILIAETGVPTSKGLAHLQPQGWNHGGHTETAQGEIDARLMGDIHEAGLAGGVLFAFLDEWFKRNWLVAEFEIPAERNPLWLNVLDPEQNYGLLAARPGATHWEIVIDGRADDWSGLAPLVVKRAGGPEKKFGDRYDASRTLRSLAVTSDEAYVYVRLEVEKLDADGDGAPDWKQAAYLIGIDTYDVRRGDHRMPIHERVPSPAGLEFCLIFDGPATSRLLVDPPYDIETHRYHRPYQSVANDDGRFMEIKVETNRRRIGRDGTLFPAQGYSRSPLLHASMDRRDPDYSTLADWHAGVAGNFIEARIPWGLLNVTDPSSRRVLHDNPNDLRSIGTLETPGFHFYAVAVKPDGPPGGGTPIDARLADRLPAGDGLAATGLPLFTWHGWDQPTYRLEKKDSWSLVKQAFQSFRAVPEAP